MVSKKAKAEQPEYIFWLEITEEIALYVELRHSA